jgi:hypothetical protein
MKRRDHLLHFAIGSALLMVLNGTILKYNDSNSWIPIAVTFGCFSILAIIVRSAIIAINERLGRMEERRKA